MTEQEQGNAIRVLFLEDDQLARWVVGKSIEQAGHKVTSADTCARAEELIDSCHFDVVVLDNRLPDGTGIDLLRRIRAKGWNHTAVVMSADSEDVEDAALSELGAVAVLSKPVKMDELLAIFREHVRQPAPREAGLSAGKAHPGETTPGRFKVFRAGNDPATGLTEVLAAASADEAWIAVAMNPHDRIDATLSMRILEMARHCRSIGGRLCIVAQDASGIEAEAREHLSGEVDVYPDFSWLDPAGRRASSMSERALLTGKSTSRRTK